MFVCFWTYEAPPYLWVHVTYSITPFIRNSNYPVRLGPSGNFVEKVTILNTNMPENYRCSNQVRYRVMAYRTANQVWSKGIDAGLCVCLFVFGAIAAPSPPSEPWPPHSWGFLDHTQRRTTVGGTPLDEWSTSRRDHYLTTRNTNNRQTSMPPVGFEPKISAGEWPQTYALDRAATGTGIDAGTYCK